MKKIINDGFISDDNEHYNDAYTDIVWCNDYQKII